VDDALNPVLWTSFYWTFRTRYAQFSYPDPRSPSLQNWLTLLMWTWEGK